MCNAGLVVVTVRPDCGCRYTAHYLIGGVVPDYSGHGVTYLRDLEEIRALHVSRGHTVVINFEWSN